MEHLYIARHGDYQGAELTEKGRKDIANLADKIMDISPPSIIISSKVKRAWQSAEIFAKRFRLDPKAILKHDCFYNFDPDKLDIYTAGVLCKSVYGLMEMLQTKDEEKAVAVLTHGGFGEFFTEVFTGHHFGVDFGMRDLDKSTAYDINKPKKEAHFLDGTSTF